jgi:hypothetical protein
MMGRNKCKLLDIKNDVTNLTLSQKMKLDRFYGGFLREFRCYAPIPEVCDGEGGFRERAKR